VPESRRGLAGLMGVLLLIATYMVFDWLDPRDVGAELAAGNTSSGWSSRACSSSPPPSSSAPSTSSAADGVASGEPRGGELRVARAAGREVAPHERHTLDGEPRELASLAGQQGVGQRRIARRDAHTGE